MTCSGFGQANTAGQPPFLNSFLTVEMCREKYWEGLRGLVKTTNMEWEQMRTKNWRERYWKQRKRWNNNNNNKKKKKTKKKKKKKKKKQ